MILSSRRKIENKSTTRHMRPSLFLNEFDVSSLLTSPSVKTESNEKIRKKNEEPTYTLNTIPESNSFVVLPQIEERFLIKQREKHHSTELIESRRESKKIITEQIKPKSEIKLPMISPNPLNKRHSRRFTSDDIVNKKVEFRPSILIIDFINDVITKDSLDGSVKPLTKKLYRQQTKFIKQNS